MHDKIVVNRLKMWFHIAKVLVKRSDWNRLLPTEMTSADGARTVKAQEHLGLGC